MQPLKFYDVPASSQDSDDSNLHSMLKLPSSVTGVTKHHEDFVRWEDAEVTDAVRDSMQQQWASLVMPGWKVKVKIKDQFVSAVVEKCHFISKLSINCLYCFATANDLQLTDSGQLYRNINLGN